MKIPHKKTYFYSISSIIIILLIIIFFVFDGNILSQTPSFKEVYTDNAYHFSVHYPENLQSTSFSNPSGPGEVILLLATSTSGAGLQIIITPQNGSSTSAITVGLIKNNIPNLSIVNPENVTIDGIGKGVSFFDGVASSSDRQIWFIARGDLYQITMPETFDVEGREIVNTLKFAE